MTCEVCGGPIDKPSPGCAADHPADTRPIAIVHEARALLESVEMDAELQQAADILTAWLHERGDFDL